MISNWLSRRECLRTQKKKLTLELRNCIQHGNIINEFKELITSQMNVKCKLFIGFIDLLFIFRFNIRSDRCRINICYDFFRLFRFTIFLLLLFFFLSLFFLLNIFWFLFNQIYWFFRWLFRFLFFHSLIGFFDSWFLFLFSRRCFYNLFNFK